jgi:hypothetical protein
MGFTARPGANLKRERKRAAVLNAIVRVPESVCIWFVWAFLAVQAF